MSSYCSDRDIRPREAREMARGVQRHAMRQDLLDAAASIIGEHGIDALTIRSLTVRAQCASGVLYNYFDDLDEVVAELVAVMFAETVAAVQAITAKPGLRPVADVLGEIASTMLRDANFRIASAAMSRPGVVGRVRAQFADNDAPNLATLAQVIAEYLCAEQGLGRVSNTADIETGSWLLVWALHEALITHHNDPSREAIGFDRIAQTIIDGLGTES